MRETQNPQVIEDGANEAGQPVSRPLSRPSPSANLAGNWKGDPLIREVRDHQVHPDDNRGIVAHLRDGCHLFNNVMRDAIYVGVTALIFAASGLKLAAHKIESSLRTARAKRRGSDYPGGQNRQDLRRQNFRPWH
jgi:hypothetical protein